MPRATRPPKVCSTCPQPVVAPTAQSRPTLAVTSTGEGERLWKHVLFGTGTCISMVAGYAELGMPGQPLPRIIELRDRLNSVIQLLESKKQ